MRQKPVSLKKLYEYAAEFMFKKHRDEKRWYGAGKDELEAMLDKSEVKQFLDFVVKKTIIP